MKNKKYKVKPTQKQLAIMKEGWKQFKSDYNTFWRLLSSTEKWMEDETGIKGIEFIKDQMFGGDWMGIGNADRTMKLYQAEELGGY